MVHTKFKAVIFDLDGTLVNSLRDIATLMNRVLNEFGYPSHPKDSYKTFVGDGADILVSRVLPKDKLDMKDQILKVYLPLLATHGSDHAALYPGVAKLLDYLNYKSIPIAILSNKPHDSVKLVVDKILNKWRFANILGDQPGLAKKPNPQGALAISNALHIPPSSIMLVGDSDLDMITAINADMYPVGVTWGFRTKEELLNAGAKLLVDKPLEQLIPILDIK